MKGGAYNGVRVEAVELVNLILNSGRNNLGHGTIRSGHGRLAVADNGVLSQGGAEGGHLAADAGDFRLPGLDMRGGIQPGEGQLKRIHHHIRREHLRLEDCMNGREKQGGERGQSSRDRIEKPAGEEYP